MTKLVNYNGLELRVPKYIKFIATDKNGTIWGYKLLPKVPNCADPLYWRADHYDRAVELGSIAENWKDSLKAV